MSLTLQCAVPLSTSADAPSARYSLCLPQLFGKVSLFQSFTDAARRLRRPLAGHAIVHPATVEATDSSRPL